MLSLLQARIASLWSILADLIVEVTVVRVDYHAFKLKVILTDGSTLRINEQYSQGNWNNTPITGSLRMNSCVSVGTMRRIITACRISPITNT